ncbi:flagellar biosynthetic protein FliO [Cohnella faecalis]|uniref:Flagellar protein n=1 Tax=Cohnella faecalis TaxID=2315694 RepID=A0A398CJ16_9BACL|nr:flagellar biosynthetic protein FliO [Cohnella faecalis]RIE03296.1 flagellar protein [Cohnella faecalis]
MSNWRLEGDLPSSSSTWDMLWVLFVLALMVGLIVLLLRFFAKRNRGWWMNRSLRSLGGLTLGTNKSMQIVEWNGRIYVLGVGEDVTLLESISDPDVVAALLAEHDTVNAAPAASLPIWLRKLTRQGGLTDETPKDVSEFTQPAGRSSFEQTLENRLRQLSERKQRMEQLLTDTKPEDRKNNNET